MKCDVCGKEIHGAYIGDTATGKTYCKACILGRKYDHDEIIEMYKRGASLQAIAEHVGTNPLTVEWIVRKANA